MREAYRLIEDEQTLVYGNLVVIAARAKIADAKMQEVKKDMLWCMKRVGLIERPAPKDDSQ
jgi:RNase P protein component